MDTGQKIFTIAIVMTLMLFLVPCALAYEVAVGLGSTADPSATIAMGDRSKWPVVADLSWGPLAKSSSYRATNTKSARSRFQ